MNQLHPFTHSPGLSYSENHSYIKTSHRYKLLDSRDSASEKYAKHGHNRETGLAAASVQGPHASKLISPSHCGLTPSCWQARFTSHTKPFYLLLHGILRRKVHETIFWPRQIGASIGQESVQTATCLRSYCVSFLWG